MFGLRGDSLDEAGVLGNGEDEDRDRDKGIARGGDRNREPATRHPDSPMPPPGSTIPASPASTLDLTVHTRITTHNHAHTHVMCMRAHTRSHMATSQN